MFFFTLTASEPIFFFTFTGPFKALWMDALTAVFSNMQSVVTLQTQMQLLDVERI